MRVRVLVHGHGHGHGRARRAAHPHSSIGGGGSGGSSGGGLPTGARSTRAAPPRGGDDVRLGGIFPVVTPAGLEGDDGEVPAAVCSVRVRRGAVVVIVIGGPGGLVDLDLVEFVRVPARRVLEEVDGEGVW